MAQTHSFHIRFLIPTILAVILMALLCSAAIAPEDLTITISLLEQTQIPANSVLLVHTIGVSLGALKIISQLSGALVQTVRSCVRKASVALTRDVPSAGHLERSVVTKVGAMCVILVITV